MKNIYKNYSLKGMKLFLFGCFALLLSGKASAQGQCYAQFIYSTQQGTTYFYDTSYASSGVITNYTWSFGDGTSGTGANPAHIYNATGNYTVCLMIVTSTGCVDSTCQTVTIGSPCTLTAAAVYDSLVGTATVYASGGTPPYSYSWINGATTQTISASTPGQYCCVVADANGCIYTTCVTVPGSSSCNASYVHTQSGNMVAFSNSSTGYTSLLWNFGDGQTSTATNPVHTYSQAGMYGPCLTLYSNGVQCSIKCDTVIVGSQGNSTICGNVFNDVNANGVNDTEPGFGGGYVYIWGNGAQTTAYVDSFGYYTANLPAGSYYISYCVQQPYSLTLPPDSGGCGMYQFTIAANDTICGFDFGVANNSVIIEGYLFIDSNNNGIKDAGEAGIPYQSVNVGTVWGYSNSTGKYSVYVPAGTHTVTYTPSGMYAGYALSTPGSISVNATVVGNTYGGNNFGLNIPAGSVNLGIQILPHTTITPGFPAWYDLQVCNYGVVPTGADVTMNYDGGLTLDYSYPTETSNNTTTHTLTWTLSPIAPGSCVNIRVDFDASTGYVIGASTFEEASVNPTSGIDINMSNNTDTVHQIVTSSWDPNNKLSIQTNFNDPNYQVISSVNSNQQIQYTINFQNLGTAPAVNVVVVDALASNVDASSFQMSGASHNVNVSRNGNVVTYSFAGIMLPDATANGPQSHGFVSYTVNSVNGLAAGTQISDFSNIYFDFNAPVTTNNAVVTMVNPTGISEVNADASMLNAYPNPVSSQATLQFYIGTTSNVSIDLMDASGRSVSVVNNKGFNKGVQQVEFNAANYANGVYVLKLNVNGKTSFTKISVSH